MSTFHKEEKIMNYDFCLQTMTTATTTTHFNFYTALFSSTLLSRGLYYTIHA